MAVYDRQDASFLRLPDETSFIADNDLSAESAGTPNELDFSSRERSTQPTQRARAATPQDVSTSSRVSSGRPSVIWRAKVAPGRLPPAPPAAAVPRVSVVIPALNEAENLEQVLPALPDGLFEVILVDGGSVDGTCETARRLRSDIRVIRQTRSGKGNALACGFAACTGDIIVMLDADGSADPTEIARFVDVLLAGADFAKGTRFAEDGGSADISRLRAVGNRLLTQFVNTACRTKYSDLCYGYNAFWAATCLPVLSLDWQSPAPDAGGGRLWGDGFEIETLINTRVAAANLKVVEVPSYERSRMHGVSNLNAFTDGLRVLRTILSELRRARAMRGRHDQTSAKSRPTARQRVPAESADCSNGEGFEESLPVRAITTEDLFPSLAGPASWRKRVPPARKWRV